MNMRWLAIALFVGLTSLYVTLGFAEVLGIAGRLMARVAETYGDESMHRVEAWGRLMSQIGPIRGESHMGDAAEEIQQTFSAESRAVDTAAPETAEAKEGRELEALTRVNAFFNQMLFVSDRQQWGKEDYWATPVEFLAAGGGDCEDFSLAKYFTLRELGVPLERMRLTYVKAVKLNQAHMVVAYFPTPDAEPLILDNLVPDIRRASERIDLVPVYSFNGDGLWLSKERGRGHRVGDSGRLKLWNDLKYRVETMSLAPLPRAEGRL